MLRHYFVNRQSANRAAHYNYIGVCLTDLCRDRGATGYIDCSNCEREDLKNVRRTCRCYVPPTLVSIVEVARHEVFGGGPGRTHRVETRQRLGQGEGEHLRVEAVVESHEPQQFGHVSLGPTAAE